MTARKRTYVKSEAPEPTDAEKAAAGEPVGPMVTTPDYVAPEAVETVTAGVPTTPAFTDLSARTCYTLACMSLLYAEVHAGDSPNEHRENAKAWSTLGNNMIAVGL